MAEIWIGRNFETSPNRILVLGESWYGDIEPLGDYIQKWASREVRDNTFSRIFNSGSGLHTSKASESDILDFWHTIAFYNFVTGTVGDTRSHRPTKYQYESSKSSLISVLEKLRPKGVWVLGKEQAAYSEPVIMSVGIPYDVTPHPTSLGLKAEVLRKSWLALQKKTA